MGIGFAGQEKVQFIANDIRGSPRGDSGEQGSQPSASQRPQGNRYCFHDDLRWIRKKLIGVALAFASNA